MISKTPEAWLSLQVIDVQGIFSHAYFGGSDF
ncbi:hypothetical protein HMPREF9702_04334 [Delftia acidovorans CCUG 15835]|nr:hypothetical protein HMPREF9702_04334 [Delftia acidovorans CCUG 15835]